MLLPIVQAATCLVGLLLAMILAHVGSFCYIAFAFTGSFAVYLYLGRPSRRELLWAALTSGIYLGIYALLRGQFLSYAWSGIGTPGAFLGLGSLAFVSVRWAWVAKEQRRALSSLLGWMTAVPILCVCSIAAVSIAASLTPYTYDLYLYQFDSRLGFEPSFQVGQWFATSRVLFLACALAYNSLPLLLALSLAIWQKRHGPGSADFRLACILLGVLGFVAYQVCPAAGPIYTYPNLFPFAPPAVAAGSVAPIHLDSVPRNAMPSLHVGWVLLFLWNSRGLGRFAKLLAISYLPLTALATLGSGEHYLVDLLVAVPLCLLVQAVSAHHSALTTRLMAIAAGAGILGSWLLTLRWGKAVHGISPMFSWALLATTVAACLFLKRLLDRGAAPVGAEGECWDSLSASGPGADKEDEAPVLSHQR